MGRDGRYSDYGSLGFYSIEATVVEPDSVDPIDVTPLNRGVAVTDNASGSGFLMYTAESVHTRFGNLNRFNADHIVGVRFSNGQWQYNTNSAWQSFTPRSSDILLASVDFSADTVVSLEGTDTSFNGIASGYVSGDLTYIANQWNGSPNAGEFGVTGTSFVPNDPTAGVSILPTNRGVAVSDGASGSGYMMYTAESVHLRFGNVNQFNADHIIGVRFSFGQWQYNTNSTWQVFTPVATDILLASVDFSADTVTSLEGTSGTVSGIVSGYASGDIVITPNMWNGSPNAGEFGVLGASFVPNATALSPPPFAVATPSDPQTAGNGNGDDDDEHEHHALCLCGDCLSGGHAYPLAPETIAINSQLMDQDAGQDEAATKLASDINNTQANKNLLDAFDDVFSNVQ